MQPTAPISNREAAGHSYAIAYILGWDNQDRQDLRMPLRSQILMMNGTRHFDDSHPTGDPGSNAGDSEESHFGQLLSEVLPG